MSLVVVYFRGQLAPNPKDIPEPSHCRVFCEVCLNLAHGLFSILITMHLHVLQVSGQSTLKPCIENVPDSSQCAEYADSCTNPDRLDLCQRYCGACDDRHVTTRRSTQQCKDSSIICPLRLSNAPNFCRATQNRNSCPETCGLCVSSTRLPTTSSTTRKPTSQSTTPLTRSAVMSIAKVTLHLASFGIISCSVLENNILIILLAIAKFCCFYRN